LTARLLHSDMTWRGELLWLVSPIEMVVMLRWRKASKREFMLQVDLNNDALKFWPNRKLLYWYILHTYWN